jgi:hypothetical protein
VLVAGVAAVVGVDDAADVVDVVDDDTLSGVVDDLVMARLGVAVKAASVVGVDAKEPKNPPPAVGIDNVALVADADTAAPKRGLLILPDDPKIPDAVLLLDTCALLESTAGPNVMVEVILVMKFPVLLVCVGAPKPKIDLAGADVYALSIVDPKAAPNEVVVVAAAVEFAAVAVEVAAVALKPKIGWAGSIVVVFMSATVAVVVGVAAATVVPAPVTAFDFSVGTSMDSDGCGCLLGDDGNGTTRF